MKAILIGIICIVALIFLGHILIIMWQANAGLRKLHDLIVEYKELCKKQK